MVEAQILSHNVAFVADAAHSRRAAELGAGKGVSRSHYSARFRANQHSNTKDIRAMTKPSTAIIGACGEHYIAAYLSGFKLIVAMPRGGIPGSDLFVTNEKGGQAIRVQVKTGTQATRNTKDEGEIYLWATSYAAIERDDKHLWYAYVWLNGWPNEENLPEVFFVPSKVVVKCMKGCREDNDTWPYFWMRADDAKKYQGHAGLQSLLDALDS